MELWVLVPVYAVMGALLSEIDKLEDLGQKRHELEPLILAIINSLLMAFLIMSDFGSAVIFSAILLAVALGGKIDNLPFLLGALILCGAILHRFMYTNFLTLILLPAALASNGLLDEYGNDRVKRIKPALMRWFFNNRMTMKFGVFVVAYFGIISAWHFLAFLCFDVAYALNAKRQF